MGSRMATNLLAKHPDLTIYNRSDAPARALADKGATRATSIADAVRDADLVLSMLAHPEAVEAVFVGPEGALAHMKPGAIWADCSTVNPSFSRRMHAQVEQRGLRFADAPVAGTKPAAQNAELVYFVGADDDVLTEIKPVLELMSKKVLHLGEVGKGSAFKMLVNALLAQSWVAFSETVLLGERMGLDRDFLLDTLPNLAVTAPFTKIKAAMLKAGDDDVQFPLELMAKDLHLAAVSAYEVGQPLYLSNVAKELYSTAALAGRGREDFSAIFHQLRGGTE